MQPARNSRFPLDKLPFAITATVFATPDEGPAHFHFGSQQVFPLIPASIPDAVEDGRIEPQFELSSQILIKSAIVIEFAFAEGRVKSPLPELRKEAKDAMSKKGSAIARALARCENRTEPSVGEECGGVDVPEERIVASPQFRRRQDIECPLDRNCLAPGCTVRVKFEGTKFVGDAQFRWRGRGRNPQRFVQCVMGRRRVIFWDPIEVFPERGTWQKNIGNAEPPTSYFGGYKLLVSLVLFRLTDVTNCRLIEVALCPSESILDDQKFRAGIRRIRWQGKQEFVAN